MWAVWVLAALLLLLPGLLFLPVDVSLSVERDRTSTVRLGFKWMFIRFERPLDGVGGIGRKKRRKDRNPKRFGGFGDAVRGIRDASGVPGLAGWIGRFLVRLKSAVRLRVLAGRVRVGVDDPADTGRLWGVAGPVLAWCNRWPAIDVRAEPEFSGPCLEGEVRGTLRILPARIVWAFARTLLSVTAIRLGWAIVRRRA